MISKFCWKTLSNFDKLLSTGVTIKKERKKESLELDQRAACPTAPQTEQRHGGANRTPSPKSQVDKVVFTVGSYLRLWSRSSPRRSRKTMSICWTSFTFSPAGRPGLLPCFGHVTKTSSCLSVCDVTGAENFGSFFKKAIIYYLFILL